MAIIPDKSKVKNKKNSENLLYVLITFLTVLIMFDRFVLPHIHSSFTIPCYFVMLCIVVFLLLPSIQNYGCNGAQMLIIMLRFKVAKMKEWVMKCFWIIWSIKVKCLYRMMIHMIRSWQKKSWSHQV